MQPLTVLNTVGFVIGGAATCASFYQYKQRTNIISKLRDTQFFSSVSDLYSLHASTLSNELVFGANDQFSQFSNEDIPAPVCKFYALSTTPPNVTPLKSVYESDKKGVVLNVNVDKQYTRTVQEENKDGKTVTRRETVTECVLSYQFKGPFYLKDPSEEQMQSAPGEFNLIRVDDLPDSLVGSPDLDVVSKKYENTFPTELTDIEKIKKVISSDDPLTATEIEVVKNFYIGDRYESGQSFTIEEKMLPVDEKLFIVGEVLPSGRALTLKRPLIISRMSEADFIKHNSTLSTFFLTTTVLMSGLTLFLGSRMYNARKLSKQFQK
ncbi:developmentally-regulated internal PM-anchored protein [Acrasis kona]|uniref:Developmentally-regulated internal PM-anchored protein n=1 Tax=Acrasis kona TaxID=1008807 RepID=A0AAW2YTT2_9EUKA